LKYLIPTRQTKILIKAETPASLKAAGVRVCCALGARLNFTKEKTD
jgi:hypothetical protein